MLAATCRIIFFIFNLYPEIFLNSHMNYYNLSTVLWVLCTQIFYRQVMTIFFFHFPYLTFLLFSLTLDLIFFQLAGIEMFELAFQISWVLVYFYVALSFRAKSLRGLNWELGRFQGPLSFNHSECLFFFPSSVRMSKSLPRFLTS